jgi:hypothetical protein
VARKNTVSSTPTALTPARRAGSSTIGVPRWRTWVITVCHATARSAATSLTAASQRPTRSNAHARARSVNPARGAIAACCSVHVRAGHNSCRQHQTRFTQQITTGRPPTGSSRTHTGRRSFPVAIAPQRWQPTGSAAVSTRTSTSPPASAAASTSNPASPSRAAVTETVGSSITRVLSVVSTWS